MSTRHFQHWPRQAARNITLPDTSLWFNVEVSATRYPDKPCILFYDTAISYRQLQREAEQLAGFLQQHCGVKRGDRVALFMHNSPQFVLAYYAILRADAMVVPINPMNVSAELAQVLVDCNATVLFAPQDLFAQVEPLLGRQAQHAIIACYSDYLSTDNKSTATEFTIPEMFTAPRRALNNPQVTLWGNALACGYNPAPHLATADDLCVLPYTSGTTGHPKGCIHRHRSVMHTVMTTALWHHMHNADRMLAALPLFHVTGMQSQMNGPIYFGGSIVILPRWNRDMAAQLIKRHRVTRMTAVPTMVIDLLSSPDLPSYDLSSLTGIGGGGAAMPQAIAEQLHSLCGLTFIEGYGLSETMAATHINPEQRAKQQCLGIPTFNTDSRVIDIATLTELPPGEVGEIVTHGPQVFEGYWNNPQATEECFIELGGKRFLRTGDLGRIDDEGYFYFVDRGKRMINAAGFKVWPAEVESQLYAHEAVQEAVVISTQDARRGETVKALIVLKPAACDITTAADIIEWARERMAAYKVPRVVEFVDSLPKSLTGKVLWRVLQEQEDRAIRATA